MAENTPPDSGGNAPNEAAAPGFKVELDIDDAPFLEEPEEEAPEESPAETPEAPPPVPVEGAEPKQAKLKALLANKKKLALIGGGVLVLLIGILAGVLLFSGGEEEAPAPPPPPKEEAAAPPKAEEPPPPPPDPVYTFEADPFFVELRGSEGEIRFLHCRFSLPTKNYTLHTELTAKNIAVRDAVYYYLSNKPLTFLENPDVGYALKKDLISVVNEHMTSGKYEELFFDDYFVTGR